MSQRITSCSGSIHPPGGYTIRIVCDSGVAVGQISYSDIFSIDHDRGYDEEIHAGDMVRTGPNLFPHFHVVAISGDKAWVRNVQNAVDSITDLSRCRKIISEVLAD